MTTDNDEKAPATPAEPISAEEMAQLQADPSLLIDNPELEARLDAALSTVTESTPAAVTPEPPVTPQAPEPTGEPPAKPEPPSWIDSIPEADRKQVLEDWIGRLKPEDRAQLAPVAELLRNVDQAAEQRGAANAQRDDTANIRAKALSDETDRVANAIEAGAATREDLTALAQTSALAHQAAIADNIRDSLTATMSEMGIKQVPPEVIKAAGEAADFGAAVQVYTRFIAQTAYTGGVAVGQSKNAGQAKAEAVVERARLKDEVKAELQAEGWRNASVPPVISGTPAAASGELTDEEFAHYKRLVEVDPLNIPEELERKVDAAMAKTLVAGRS